MPRFSLSRLDDDPPGRRARWLHRALVVVCFAYLLIPVVEMLTTGRAGDRTISRLLVVAVFLAAIQLNRSGRTGAAAGIGMAAIWADLFVGVLAEGTVVGAWIMVAPVLVAGTGLLLGSRAAALVQPWSSRSNAASGEASSQGPVQEAIARPEAVADEPVVVANSEDIEPLAGAAADQRRPAEPDPTDSAPRHGRASTGGDMILIVEDEDGARDLFALILHRAGYRTFAVPNAMAALEALEQPDAGFSLLLTDVVMPGMNGIELAREVRRRRPDLGVLLMSGYVDDRFNAGPELDPSQELLMKPFTGADLRERVARVLEQR